jgi:hypothetical protein
LSIVFNPFSFIRGLSCPSSIQTLLTQNCLTPIIPDLITEVFLYIVATLTIKKSLGLKVPVLPLALSCPLQTILLSDLVGCGSPLQMAVCLHFFEILSAPNGHYYLQRAVTPDPASSNFKKSVANCHYYLQRAVTPNWMGSVAL